MTARESVDGKRERFTVVWESMPLIPILRENEKFVVQARLEIESRGAEEPF